MVHLGGTFLASADPVRLMDWFEDRFGLAMQRHGDGGSVTLPVGDTVAVLGVQKARADAPAPAPGAVEREPYGRQPMMLNLRVDDLDMVVERLRGSGDDVAGPEEYEGMGRFAWTRTPDGHDIELWQP